MEAIDAAPRTYERLLHEVLGLRGSSQRGGNAQEHLDLRFDVETKITCLSVVDGVGFCFGHSYGTLRVSCGVPIATECALQISTKWTDR